MGSKYQPGIGAQRLEAIVSAVRDLAQDSGRDPDDVLAQVGAILQRTRRTGQAGSGRMEHATLPHEHRETR